MENDQLIKRLQWVEEERRKEKDIVAMLENRVVSLEGALAAANQQVKDLSGDISHLSTIVARMDQYDASLLQGRLEAKRSFEELEKEIKRKDEEAEKVRRAEIKAVEASVIDLHKELEPIPKLEKGLQTRLDEETKLRVSIEEVRAKIEGVRREEEEYTRTIRLLEDGRRQDAKRLVDLQGEVTALRKQVDDQRAQGELTSNNIKRVETRLNEVSLLEVERREAMNTFIEKQNLAVVERDRIWKEWQARFETIEKQASEVEAQLLTLDTANRDSKRSQSVLESLSQRVERRITEITEIQRLSEDRFRQEWVTFKADDQKRWTNYTLIQEEQRGEIRRQFERLSEQVTQLDEGLQEAQDMMEQANEQSGKRLQSLLAVVHEWVSNYERTLGRTR